MFLPQPSLLVCMQQRLSADAAWVDEWANVGMSLHENVTLRLTTKLSLASRNIVLEIKLAYIINPRGL